VLLRLPIRHSREGGNPDFERDAGCVPYKVFRGQGDKRKSVLD